MNALSKEVSGPNAMAKHSLLSDQQMETPPKRPKSSEGKTSANEQVSVRPLRRRRQQLALISAVLSPPEREMPPLVFREGKWRMGR